MLAELEQLRQSTAFELEQIDVDGNVTLRERYHVRVPVLEDSDGGLLCEVFLDPFAVLNYLRDA
jgi:glutathione S-transferase